MIRFNVRRLLLIALCSLPAVGCADVEETDDPIDEENADVVLCTERLSITELETRNLVREGNEAVSTGSFTVKASKTQVIFETVPLVLKAPGEDSIVSIEVSAPWNNLLSRLKFRIYARRAGTTDWSIIRLPVTIAAKPWKDVASFSFIEADFGSGTFAFETEDSCTGVNINQTAYNVDTVNGDMEFKLVVFPFADVGSDLSGKYKYTVTAKWLN